MKISAFSVNSKLGKGQCFNPSTFPHSQVVMDMLRKGNSLVDWGTFASNAIITGNSNALGDVLGENYDKIREFFQIETDAFICSATMTYFGMDDVSEEPKEHCLPEGLKEGGVTEKRQWFHQQLYSMLDAYIMDSVESLKDHGQEEEEVVRCRDPACNRTFKYRKCRTRHEQNTHSLFVEEETTDKAKTKKPEDGIFNYGCLHISLGLLIRDAEDAVKEGDGDRLIRVWKFLTFLYRLNGANKYALAGLRVQASISGLLTPRDAHRFKWNRFAGLQEGPGTRISRDLRLEQHNKIAKEEIRALGVQNINDKSVEEITKSEGSMEKIIIGTRCDLAIEKGKGHHSNKNKSRVFSNILEQVHHKSKTFKHTVGREYKAFPKLQRNIFCALDKKSTHQWINRHKRQWHRHNRYLYRQV